MLETVKIISYIVWSLVGVTTIGISIWGTWFYTNLSKTFFNKLNDGLDKDQEGEA